MFQAASKESSPPASVSASAPVGSSVSSQAATLRVTSEGLNIVGDGGVLGIGKKSSSQKEQKQKFFATRSADGNWNLLVAPSSDPSRLFLVQPAPGHKFQMTGGKGSMERMDTAAETKSANGASSNGYEEDLSVLESAEQSPGTSKSFAVPVAQLKASSSISPVSTSHTTIAPAPGEGETTATSDGTHDFSTPREQKKPTFFKSRTAKDREALKASAHHVLGKKVIFTNKRSSKTGGTSQAGHSAKQGRKSKSAGSPKFNKNIPVSVTPDERTFQSISGSCHVPAVSSSAICVSSGDVSTIVSASLQSYTSSTHSSSSGAISGEAASVFSSGSPASSSSPSSNFISDMSCSGDHLLTPTPEQYGISNSQNNSVGNEYNKTNVDDTRNKTPDKQSKILNDDDVCCEAGDKSVCYSASAGQCKSRPLLDHGSSEDGQIMENPASDGDACVCIVDELMGISSFSGINSLAEVSKEMSTVAYHSNETVSGRSSGHDFVKDSATANALDSSTENAVENSMLTSVCKSQNSEAASSETSLGRRRQQKTAVGKECLDFSSDTDDYEFVLSDSERITGTEMCFADIVPQTTSDKGSSSLKLPTDKYDTETFMKNPTTEDNRVTENASENPTEQVSVTDSENYSNRMAEKDTSASVSLRTNVNQICSEQSDSPSRTNGSVAFLSNRTTENTKCIQENQKGLKNVEADSRGEENSGDIESREGFHPKPPTSRAVDGGGDQASSQSEETLFQNTGMSLVEDCDSLASGTTQEVHEAAHALCATSEEQQVRAKKRKKRKSVLDYITEESDTEYATVVFKCSKAKKRKKRKSELENLIEMQVTETNVQGIPEGEGKSEQEPGSEMQRPGSEVQGPVSETQESGSETKECGSKVCGSDIPGPGSEIQGRGSKEQELGSAVQEPGTEVQEPGSKEQEFGSEVQEPETVVQGPVSKEQEFGSAVQEPGTEVQEPGSKEQEFGSEVQEPGTVVQEPGSEKVSSGFHSVRPEKGSQETKKQKKKKKKKNDCFIQIDSLPAAGSGDDGSASRANVSQLMDVANSGPPIESVSQCLPHADQNVSGSSQRLTSEGAAVGVGQLSYTHRLEEETVREVQTLGRSVEKARKKKKKKLKIVFGNGQETTREIPAGVNIDDLGPVSECETGNSVTHLQNVTLPDVDNDKQTDLSGDLKQKKKRKKRLSELETLIHDQEAYALHLDTIEESQTTSTFEKSVGHNVDMTVDDTQCEAEAREKGRDEVPHERGVTENDQSKERCSSNRSGVGTTETARKDAEPSSARTREVADSLPVGRLYAASEKQAKKDVLHTVKSKVDKTKKKKKRKKLVTAGVLAMPPVTLGLDTDTAKGENTVEKSSVENTDTATGKHCAENGSTENTYSTLGKNSVEKGSLENTDTGTGEKSEEKGSLENTDLNCSLSDDASLSAECSLSKDVLSDSESEDEVTEANKAMKRFLTTRSFGKWELARMFGSPFVVLERLSEQDVYFMSRRFRNARVSSRARCTVHCRLRTLGYLCRLKLINCKPPPSSVQDVSDKQEDAASNVSKKKTERRNKDGCEKDSEGKKRKRKQIEEGEKESEGRKRKKKRQGHSTENSSEGDPDVIIVADSPSKTSGSTPNSQENDSRSGTGILPSFPSASFGRILMNYSGTSAPIAVPSNPATTSTGPCLITVPSAVTNRTSSVPQVIAIPSFGNCASRPSSLPQVIAISSLGNALSSANRIVFPPVLLNSSASSLRDATRASLTQAISNSLCKTGLVTPRPATPVIATTAPIVSVHSAPVQPIVVQGTVSSQSSLMPKGPIIVQTTVAPPSATALPKGPILVQTTVASSTAPAPQGSSSTPKQFIVVQMGDKRVLVPASALTSATTTSTVLSTCVPAAATVTTTSRPLFQSSQSSVGVQPSVTPTPTVVSPPSAGLRQQSTSLVPGSMARVILSNRRPNTLAPRTGPTASTLLFAGRAGTRPNQAWTGPRTVDSHRRVMVTPSSQPQGVRVVLTAASALPSGTQFTVSSSRGGVFVTSLQSNNMMKVASPRQSRPGKRVMTEEERLRKRARLEKKYPLPPGVVIKTESESRGYSDEGKTTQANSSARVFVSTVPVGSGSRAQVNLAQPIPVLSAFRGSPIVIRQALPTSSASRTPSILGPVIIRMPNATANTNNSASGSCVTSRSIAVTASSLLSSLNRVSSSTTSTLPLTYSLLNGNTTTTSVTTRVIPSSSVSVSSSTSVVTVLPQQSSAQSGMIASCAPSLSVHSAPSGSSSVSGGSVQRGNDHQETNSDDDAIYIVDSPPPVVQSCGVEDTPSSCSQTPVRESVTSVSSTEQGTSGVTSEPSSSVTPPPFSSSAVSPVTTTVVYTSQSPIMVTSPMPSTTTTITPSSRMASLGALWVRQAAESPHSIPSIDTRSLQSDRMQRLKEMLAKQMESMGDERRQKALQALHRQFCQTASPAEVVSREVSQLSTDDGLMEVHTVDENSEGPGHQPAETSNSCGSSETGESGDSGAAEEGTASDSREPGGTEHCEGRSERAGEADGYGGFSDIDQEEVEEGSGSSAFSQSQQEEAGKGAGEGALANSEQDRQNSAAYIPCEQDRDETGCVVSSNNAEDALVVDAEQLTGGPQPTVTSGRDLEENWQLDGIQDGDAPQMSNVAEPAHSPSAEVGGEEEPNRTASHDGGDITAGSGNNSDCDVDYPKDSCYTCTGESVVEGHCLVTSHSESNPEEENNDADKNETDVVDGNCTSGSLGVPGDGQSDAS